MSKPRHYMRGRGFYAGYGFMSVELNARKGSLSYSQYLADEIKNLPGSACSDLYCKLCVYLERAR